MATKRKTTSDLLSDNVLQNGIDLFVNEPADEEEVDSDSTDSSESEESEYSGLEEEDESSDDEMSEDDSDDAVVDDDDDEDDDDDSSNNDTSTITITSIKKKGNVQKSEKLDNVPKFKIKDNANTVKSDIRDNAKQPKKPKGKKVSSKQKENINAVAEKESDEYDHDSSDEEDIRNTVGNIPLEWYKNLPHIGYDVEGRKLIKPEQADNLDDFLNKVDDPNYWRTVTNKMTGQNVVLSKDDVDLIQNLQGRKHPTASSEDQFAPWVDIFSNEVMIHPLSNRPEHKRSFIPSKWEKLKVGQMVHALKMGWMKPSKTEKEKEEEEDDTDKYYMLWKDEDESEINKRFRQHIPAPKMVLPGHEESYNPPPEYLFTKEEEEKWEETEPEDRRVKFIPQKYSSLRSVPAFKTFINERFERCLDLYLCPRQRKMRMNVNLEDLLPKLPKPKDLQPFPTTQSLVYKGHTDLVRCISADPSGQWLVSGSDDHTVRVWEVSTGRCMKTFNVEDTIKSISWNPNPAVSLIACAVDKQVLILNPGVGDKLQVSNTDNMLNAYEQQDDSTDSKLSVTWSVHEGQEYEDGLRLKILHGFEVTQVVWHGKGDYFAVVMPKGVTKSVFIHQLSRRRSQNPFSKSKGIVQCIQFHPLRPFLFVATQRFVRVYNLLKQELSKKLMTNCKWVSSMAVHPEGDNVIIGSYDSRLGWFDMDLSTKPYQTLRHHKKAIRQVCYHRRYPLFASASDDCSIIVCHGMVYNDLLQNPLIVPVKVLRGHTQEKGVGILDCIFHPTQPWIFSAGADGTIRLYT